MKLAALLALILGTAVVLPAQEAEFRTSMKTLAASMGALNKLESKATPEAVRTAERMAGIYEEMIGFWRQRDAPDAVKLSVEGKAAAVTMASAAHAGDVAKAGEAFKSLSTTCKPCHEAYREKRADGSYAFKPIPEEK
jgi:cytochrome c556